MITANSSLSQNVQSLPESIINATNNSSPAAGIFWGNNYGTVAFEAGYSSSLGKTAWGVSFSRTSKYVSIGMLDTASAGAGLIFVFGYSSSGLSTSYSQPSVWSATSTSVRATRMSDNDAYLVAVDGVSPFIHAWAFSSSGFGTKSANPSTLPTAGNGETLLFASSATSTYLMYSGVGGTSRTTYAFNTSTGAFGSTVTQPTMSNYAVRSASFDQTRAYYSLGVAATTPGVYTWPFNSSTGAFGTQVSTNAPTEQQVYALTWNNQNTVVLTGHSSSAANPVKATPWNNGTYGTVYSAPSTLPNGFPSDLFMNSSQSVISVSRGFSGASGGMDFYDWSSSLGWGSYITSPSSTGYNRAGRKAAYTPARK